MADDFKTIFEAEPQFQRLLQDLDNVNKKYGQSTAEINKQEEEIQALLAQEKKLLDARSKAQNPNMAVKLNKELELTKKKITDLNNQLRQTSQANQAVNKTAKEVGDRMGRAFAVASITAAKKEIQETAKELRKVEEVVPKKNINAFRKLQQEVKAAQGELTEAELLGDPQKIQEANDKLDVLKNRLEDIANVGNKFEKAGRLFRATLSELAGGGFDRAAQQSKRLLDVTKSITLKEAIGGVKDLGQTFVNLGKVLLLNPIFLIGASIGLIIKNFDELKKQGGFVGAIFRGISKGIEALTFAVTTFTDAIGATTVALDRLNQKQIEFLQKSKDLSAEISTFAVGIRKAQNREALALQIKAFEDQKRFAELEIAQIKKGYEIRGILARDFEAEDKKRIEELEKQARDAVSQADILLLTEITKARDRIRELQLAVATEINKSKAFDVEFRLKPLTKEQVQASFKLQRQELERQRKEEVFLANREFEDLKKRGEVIAEINKKFGVQNKLLREQEKLEIINAAKEAGEIEIGIRRDVAEKNNELLINNLESVKDIEEKRLAILSAITVDESLVESEKATIKLAINNSYYDELAKISEKDFNRQIEIASAEIELLKKTIEDKKDANFDTTKDQQELNEKLREFDVLLSKSTIEQLKIRTDAERAAAETEREINDALFNEIKAANEELTRDEETQLTLRNASQSRHTLARVHDYQRQLDTLSLLERENTKEYRDLLAEKKKADQQYVKEVIQEYVDAYATISQAAFDATKQVLQQQLDSLNKQTELQEKRVEDAKAIAEKGNAEQLEEEEKRLDDLNKKREKFVRQQQALATAELISNTAIAVSKAAAEGGVAAGATIAAALLALVAGLATARSIASQAAFYKGGEFEGYTGDGNPTQESTAVGRKPYVYHKREFIFNHQKTGENLDIFRRIHRGQVNLKDWENKVKMYDLNKARFNVGADTTMNPVILQQNGDIKALEGKLDGVIKAIQSQPGMKIALTKEGVYGFVTAYEARQDLIKELAGGK